MKSLKKRKRNRLSQNARSRRQWEIQVKVKITLCGNLETFSEDKFCPLRPCGKLRILVYFHLGRKAWEKIRKELCNFKKFEVNITEGRGMNILSKKTLKLPWRNEYISLICRQSSRGSYCWPVSGGLRQEHQLHVHHGDHPHTHQPQGDSDPLRNIQE